MTDKALEKLTRAELIRKVEELADPPMDGERYRVYRLIKDKPGLWSYEISQVVGDTVVERWRSKSDLLYITKSKMTRDIVMAPEHNISGFNSEQ